MQMQATETEMRTKHILTRNLKVEIVREILEWEQGPALVSKADSCGKTPLHYALLHQQHGAVSLLLNAEASLGCVPDNEGLFPVYVAAMMGNIRDIVELVERCPDYDELLDVQGRNFLHCAVEHDQDNVVEFICRNDRFTVLLNAVDYEGNTPLHLAVKHGHPRIVSSLLQILAVEVHYQQGWSDCCRSCLQSSGAWLALFPGNFSFHRSVYYLFDERQNGTSSSDNVWCAESSALFVWLIGHQPTVLFSQNKSATSNQAAVLFSKKPAPIISHQPNEQASGSEELLLLDKSTCHPRSRRRSRSPAVQDEQDHAGYRR
jgi:ankyrin repeat protein